MDIKSFSTIGFSGSRRLPEGAPVQLAVKKGIASGCQRFLVGDAKGVDSFAIECLESFGIVPEIYHASDYGKGRQSFARRSIAVVSEVASASGLWISFVGDECPSGLAPSDKSSKCFCGKGSGSWASLAYAIGKGCDIRLWCPPGIEPPSSWGMVKIGRSQWWKAGHFQGRLF